MSEPIITAEAPKRAFLISIRDEKLSARDNDSLIRELIGLTDTLGLHVVSQETVHVREKNPQYGMGTGKAEELAQKAASVEAGCIVFDRDLSPSRQRNWEELAHISVIDRQELIIQIFAGRARTREAELQVSLAELKYALPRLQHRYVDLSRQRGGRYGTRGSGEARLETDRRQLEQRIHQLEGELEDVRRGRQVQRRQRERRGMPVCAIVGYTNAGKSSLLNALTGAAVLAEDKLFATLDSTSRRLKLPLGAQVLMVDTVGFIRDLPHNLVDAFRSTLEEVTGADLLLVVLDASDPDVSVHYETTLSVIRDLGAENIPLIKVLSKIDKVDGPSLDTLLKMFPESAPVSVMENGPGFPRGLTELCECIEHAIPGGNLQFRFPLDRTDLAALVHRSGAVLSEKYGEDYIEMEALVDERTAGRLREYIYSKGTNGI